MAVIEDRDEHGNGSTYPYEGRAHDTHLHGPLLAAIDRKRGRRRGAFHAIQGTNLVAALCQAGQVERRA